MSKINCIIIEDEPLAAKILADYVSQVPFLHLQETFRDAILATEYLGENQTDLIFLDIHLPRLKGLSFLKTLVDPPSVIITTAYHQYAVEGFELNVVDYLLKPIEFERFLVAVNKVRRQSPVTAEEKNHIFINYQHKKVRIPFADILFIESQREYVRIVTKSKEYLAKMGTQEMESMLPSNHFLRVHRSFIVAKEKIDSFTSELLDIAGHQIPVGRAYRDIIEKLG